MDQEIPFDHEYLASDVEFVIRKLHTSYAIHEEILSDKGRSDYMKMGINCLVGRFIHIYIH
jgi:hypothetical protein